jgi:hypothetical protein
VTETPENEPVEPTETVHPDPGAEFPIPAQSSWLNPEKPRQSAKHIFFIA